MTVRCAITELPEGQCAGRCCQPTAEPGRAAPRPEPAPPARVNWRDVANARQNDRPGWYRARSRGQCAQCGQLYAAGVLVTHHEATGGWIAECCDPDAPSIDTIPGGEGPDGSNLWARLLAKAAEMGEAA